MQLNYRTVFLCLMLLLPPALAAQETAVQPPPETSAAASAAADAVEEAIEPAVPTPAVPVTMESSDSVVAEIAAEAQDGALPKASEAAQTAGAAVEAATERAIDGGEAVVDAALEATDAALTPAVESIQTAAETAAAADPSAATDSTASNPDAAGALAADQVPGLTDPANPDQAVADQSVDENQTAGADQTTAAFGLLDQNRLNAFLDGLVEASMLQDHLPGVVVTIVEGDQIVSSRGWGFANLEKRQAASPANSLFRVGSITKVVTATALMQLVERGQLDLDQPVTRYLDPAPFAEAEAVTLKHLLTHRAGFEDGYLGHFMADDAATDFSLEDYVNRFPPQRVRGPGEFSSYSNYSTAVLGHVLAQVSGSSYESYMDDQLLAALGMQQSSFRESAVAMPDRQEVMSTALAEQRAQGYAYRGGMQKPNGGGWLHRGMAPAGALSASAEDMARFMRLHLNGGQLDGVQLLRRETIDQMHQEVSRNHPAVGGNAHGFWVNELGGLKTLEHGGAIFNFYSNMVLIPEANVGIFVSTNGGRGRQFTQDLPRLVVEHFLASRAPVPATATDFAERASALTGIYRSTRRNYSKFEAVSTLFNSDTTVSIAEPNTLLIDSGDGPRSYTEREPGVFVSDRDGRTMAFSAPGDGQAQRLYSNYGHVVHERVSWYAQTQLFWAVFGTLLALSVLRVMGLRVRKAKPAGPASHSAAVIGWLAALGWVAFSIGMMMLFSALSKPESALFVHFPNQLAIWVIGIGIGAAVLSVLCLILLPFVIRGDWPWWRRWHFALFTLAAVLSLPLLWYWRVLGYHLYGTTSVLLPPLMGG